MNSESMKVKQLQNCILNLLKNGIITLENVPYEIRSVNIDFYKVALERNKVINRQSYIKNAEILKSDIMKAESSRIDYSKIRDSIIKMQIENAVLLTELIDATRNIEKSVNSIPVSEMKKLYDEFLEMQFEQQVQQHALAFNL